MIFWNIKLSLTIDFWTIIEFTQKNQISSAQKHNLNLHRVFERKKSDSWFVNLTDIQVPDSVQDMLRLGKGYSSNMISDKSKQMIEIIKKVCILVV